ncbi:TonB-dependent siderophore receptor [soil metagenome]
MVSAASTVSARRLIAVAVMALAAQQGHAQTGAVPSPMQRASIDFTIPAQPLDQALGQLARQAKLQLMASPALLQGQQGRSVEGNLSVNAAVARLLQGTGLLGRIEGGTLVIERESGASGALSGTTLTTVTVTAQSPETATGPVNGYVARRSATATKTDTPLLEVPQSISVIGREEMDARGVQDVMEAIRYSPGITVGIYGPDNRGWDLMLLRGFDTSYSTYLDGLSQTLFGINRFLTEPYALERVEVLRGPASMAFGQGDAGGVINRVGKQPTGETIRELEVQYGSFDRKQLAFDIGDRFGADSDLSYRLIGLTLDSNDQDRYPDGHKLNRKRTYLAPSVRWQPSTTTSLTLYANFLDNKSQEDPYYFGVNNVLTDVKMGDWSFSRMTQRQSAVGYRFETALDSDWTLRQNFRYSHVALSRRTVWVDEVGADDRTISRIARTWDDPVNQASLDTHVQGKLRTGDVAHTLLFGLDFSEQRGKARRFAGPAPTLDLLDPIYGQPVDMPHEPLANYEQTTRQIGLYAQDQIKFADRWVLTLGGRQDNVRSVTDDHLNAEVSTKSDDAFSGRAGLSYLVGNGWAPYVGYTESFLPISGADADNNPFKPTRGKQVEAGVKFQPEGSRTLVTAAVFDLRKTNVVTYDPVNFEGRQIGKQRSRGLEFEAKGEIVAGLNALASYTWMDTKVLESADPGEAGKIPPLVPRQTASAWLDYTLGNGMGVGAGVRYIGRRANDEYNTSFERGVTLIDAALHYEQGPWRLALNVSNLLNKDYNAICYHGECYRGNLRNATVTARYRF